MNQDNLLLLVPSLKLGGQERVAVHTAKTLGKMKNVFIAVFDSKNAVYETDAEVIDLNLPTVKNKFLRVINVFRRVRALKRLKRERNIGCTFSFGDTANLANALSRTGDRIVLSVRGYASIPSGGFGVRLWQYLYQKADLVLCVAKKLTEDLMQVCKITPEKAITVYNPYDIEKIRILRAETAPIEIEKQTIVSVGRLEDVKGYRHLLRATALAIEQVPDLKLVLVGDGEAKQSLFDEVNRLGLEEHVLFAGFQKNPFAITSRCRCYVLSSINEGFPNAMVEAMACGVPAIAVDCETGPREIFGYDKPGALQSVQLCEYGILCPAFESDFSDEPKKDRVLADAIVKILTDPQVYAAYRARAEMRAKMFSFEQYRDRLLEVLFAIKK